MHGRGSFRCSTSVIAGSNVSVNTLLEPTLGHLLWVETTGSPWAKSAERPAVPGIGVATRRADCPRIPPHQITTRDSLAAFGNHGSGVLDWRIGLDGISSV